MKSFTIEYHDNGKICLKGQKNSKGERDGIEERFYDNGNIRWRVTYKKGKLDGIAVFFHKDGNVTDTQVWKDGELIEETKHQIS